MIRVTDNPVVLIETTMGVIKVEVYPDKAPITANNFLRYVDAGLYDGTTFFRTVTMQNQPDNDVRIEVIQGGQVEKEKEFEPITLERTTHTGLSHIDGVISMSRFKPDSARSSFFFCINDQLELDYGGKRYTDGQGFAAFGKVTEGMDNVREIQVQPHEGQRLTPPILIKKARRVK